MIFVEFNEYPGLSGTVGQARRSMASALAGELDRMAGTPSRIACANGAWTARMASRRSIGSLDCRGRESGHGPGCASAFGYAHPHPHLEGRILRGGQSRRASTWFPPCPQAPCLRVRFSASGGGGARRWRKGTAGPVLTGTLARLRLDGLRGGNSMREHWPREASNGPVLPCVGIGPAKQRPQGLVELPTASAIGLLQCRRRGNGPGRV